MSEQATRRVVTYDVDKIEEILKSFDENLSLKGFQQIDTIMTAVNYLQHGGTISEVPVEEGSNAAPQAFALDDVNEATEVVEEPVVESEQKVDFEPNI